MKAGRILLPGGGVIDCTIRDLSDAGAKLKLGAPSPLPEAFELLTVSTGLVVSVERRWQKGVDVGVAFVGPPRSLDQP